MSEERIPLPNEPSGDAERRFAEPWHAQVFAITLTLHQRGLFSWPEWVEAFAAQIAAGRPGDPDQGDTYYHHWLTALERIVAKKEVSSTAELEYFREAWAHAAERTPHGQPIELDASDFHNQT